MLTGEMNPTLKAPNLRYYGRRLSTSQVGISPPGPSILVQRTQIMFISVKVTGTSVIVPPRRGTWTASAGSNLI